MRDIQELLAQAENYKTVLVQKRFASKKNTVAYVLLDGQPRVLKWFVPGLKQNMETEYAVLKQGCSALQIPSPLQRDTEHHVLVMNYIQGHNVCDVINDPHTVFEEKEQVVSLLADWCVRFHTFFKTEQGFRIRGDATLRNFIYSKKRVWGVDFEESRSGTPGEDLATLCGSVLSTDPMFVDEKFQLCQRFLETYRKSVPWTVEKINAEISYALLERIQWRSQDEELLRKYAAMIRKDGLRVARRTYASLK